MFLKAWIEALPPVVQVAMLQFHNLLSHFSRLEPGHLHLLLHFTPSFECTHSVYRDQVIDPLWSLLFFLKLCCGLLHAFRIDWLSSSAFAVGLLQQLPTWPSQLNLLCTWFHLSLWHASTVAVVSPSPRFQLSSAYLTFISSRLHHSLLTTQWSALSFCAFLEFFWEL